MKKLIAITIALFGAAACVEAPPDLKDPVKDPVEDPVDDPPISDDPVVDDPSDIPDLGTPEAETAHGIYVQKLYPSVKATCGACHVPDNGNTVGPQWLDGSEEASYVLTKGYAGILTKEPANSLLLTHKHSAIGTELSDDQKGLVTEWLTREQEENPTADPDPPKGASLNDWLSCFSKAMDYTRWETTGMSNFPLQQVNGGGNCNSCHNQGLGSTYLNEDPQLTFDHMKEYPYTLRLVKPVYDSGVIVALTLETRMIVKGGEECLTPPTCHPNFQLSAAREQALTEFVSQTGDAMDLVACGIK